MKSLIMESLAILIRKGFNARQNPRPIVKWLAALLMLVVPTWRFMYLGPILLVIWIVSVIAYLAWMKGIRINFEKPLPPEPATFSSLRRRVR